ncbi:protein fantom [Eucyclogobius newberryi]|uniref:protein fantom n=1 Tax=Eucyclogobius newberryi TaxID=166745 RepID=UPI003B5C6FCE
MSCFDDTAADVPVKDISLDLPRLALGISGAANVRARQDVVRMSREQLEDKFLRLNDENLSLKQRINKQDEKMKKLATKLMRLVKDRNRLEQLASGVAPQPGHRVRDVGMEELVENLQDNVRDLQAENESLKRRLRVAKQQILQQNRRNTAYNHVQSRINSGMRKLRDTPSPAPARPRSAEGRPPTGQLPRYGQSLLEEARAEIRKLENVIESQRSHTEALEGDAQLLWDELSRKEAEFEQRLVDAKQQQSASLRTSVSSNVNMIKVQQQLAERSDAIAELQGRFLQLQESQQTLKASHDAALSQLDSVTQELKEERLRSLELEQNLRSAAVSSSAVQQLQEQICELEQERDLLKENNDKLLKSAFDVSQQQKWHIQEQKLMVQISQLETALQADLTDKNEILDKVKSERETNEKLTEENQKLHVQFLEQKQQLEEMKDKLNVYSQDGDYDVSELTEALLLVKERKSQRSGELAFLAPVSDAVDGELRELRAALAETAQELEKTRSLLSVESRISRGYKAELDTVSSKVRSERAELDQRLESQARLLDSRAARIQKLEAQLKDIAYDTKTIVFKPDPTPAEDEDEADELNESLDLERGENVLELQICSASLSPAALGAASDPEPSTFCTYCVHTFELHSTRVASGPCPKYGYTSRYDVLVDQAFVDYVSGSAVTVELHQALGQEWRTLATGQIRLQPLMEREGKVHGSIPLIGVSDEARSFGSLDYWFRLQVPMRRTLLLYKEKLKAEDRARSSDLQLPLPDDRNELRIAVHGCSGLRSGRSGAPSPYVVYRFYDRPENPTRTAHDSAEPRFDAAERYAVVVDRALHRYLSSEAVQFSVYDHKEEEMEVYLGKTKVPLEALARDEDISGWFELSDSSRLPAGHIQLSLTWARSYRPPPGSEVTAEGPGSAAKPRASEGAEELDPERPKPAEGPQTQAKEEPRTGTRETEEPWTGTRATKEPWAGTRGTEEPWAGTRATEEPWTGTRATKEPRAGTRATEEPRAGTRVTEEPWAGTRATEEPWTGTRATKEPRAGTRETEEPWAGTRATEEPWTGTRATKEPRAGTRGTEEPRTRVTEEPWAGTRATEEPWTGTRATKEPRAGTRGTEEPRTRVTEEPWAGTRATEEPWTGTRATKEPRAGTRGTEEPLTRVTEEPWAGTRVTEESWAGTRATKEPRAGTRATEEPRAGTRATEEPWTGTRATKEPQSGTRATKEPRAGTRVTEEPRAGTRAMEEPRTGTRATEEPRALTSGTRATEGLRAGTSGTRATEEPRALTSGTRATEGLRAGTSRTRATEEPRAGTSGTRATEEPRAGTSGTRATEGLRAGTRSMAGVPMVHPRVGVSKAPLPKLRQRTSLKDGKKVSFMSALETQVGAGPVYLRAAVIIHVYAAFPGPSRLLAAPDDDDDDVSQFSEGQLLASSSESDDDSDPLSYHAEEDVQNVPKENQNQNQNQSPSTDSDDCIVHAQAAGRKASERLRVEVVSLSLRAESRVSRDASVVRLFVEYSLLDVGTVETPVSLPKPPPGHSVSFNHSKVIPVDAEEHGERRRLLRSVLQGKSPHMETVRFTVVSEPLEEEEQEQECEDVGVAFLTLPEILQNQRDLNEAPLQVLDAEDQSEVMGVLTVSVEALSTLQAVMEDTQLD